MNETDNPQCTVEYQSRGSAQHLPHQSEVNARARHFIADIQIVMPA